MTAHRLARLPLVVVVVASGCYLLVYLYRWEWNRALISGLFFLIAEIALAASMILGRLRALEERLDRSPASPGVDEVLGRVRETAPPDRAPFNWLEDSTQRFQVFVPVLMGAGVVLSGLAYLVERAASATAKPLLERELAGRLASLAVPAGGFLTAAPSGSSVLADDRPPVAAVRRRYPAPVRVAAVVAAAGLGFLAVDTLAAQTQNGGDPVIEGTTHLDLQVVYGRPAAVVDTAEAFWAVCRAALPSGIDVVDITATGSDRVRMSLSPALGRHGSRRFLGCVEDVTLDRVQASVVGVETIPAS